MKLILTKLQTVVIPHTLKVALYVFLSTGLTGLLDALSGFKLTPIEFIIAQWLINSALVTIKKLSE